MIRRGANGGKRCVVVNWAEELKQILAAGAVRWTPARASASSTAIIGSSASAPLPLSQQRTDCPAVRAGPGGPTEPRRKSLGFGRGLSHGSRRHARRDQPRGRRFRDTPQPRATLECPWLWWRHRLVDTSDVVAVFDGQLGTPPPSHIWITRRGQVENFNDATRSPRDGSSPISAPFGVDASLHSRVPSADQFQAPRNWLSRCATSARRCCRKGL